MSSEKKAASSEVTRRSFLQTGSTVAAGLAWTAQSYGSILGANDRIRVGFIGAGGMANAHMNTYNAIKEKNNVEAIAVADCWKTRAEEGKTKTGAQHAFDDYRKVLEIKDIDYVTIATPEHWHAQMTIDAWMPAKPSIVKNQ
jgi:NADH/NAD ratio-sensing transcriptional regulator Rex